MFSFHHHQSLSLPAAECALACDSCFHRSLSLTRVFREIMSSSVHALMSSLHLLYGRPLFLFPLVLSSRQILLTPQSILLMWPNSLLLMTAVIGGNLVICLRFSFLTWSSHKSHYVVLKTSSFCSAAGVQLTHSSPYTTTERT